MACDLDSRLCSNFLSNARILVREHEDFVKYFEYYLSAHAPKQNPSPGLADTIAQAKDELWFLELDLKQ